MKQLMIVWAASAWCWTAFGQDHGHLDVGAVGKNQGDKLTWVAGPDFVETSGYVKTFLTPTNPKYAGFFDGNITLTALHHTNALGEPNPAGPAPGAFVVGEIVSVTGPEGGSFGFWDTNSTAGNPSFSIPVGTSPTNVRFDVSEARLGAGQPGADPYGHVHGRRMSVTKPGIYTVGFRAVDTSTSGSAGGPIHAPSDVLKITFQAGFNIRDIAWANGVSTVRVGTAIGSNFTLQSSTNLNEANQWVDVSASAGNDHFQSMIDDGATNAARFYRVIVTPAQ